MFSHLSIKDAFSSSVNSVSVRTILTSFAGSIGIIGISLILSLSNGVQNYIDKYSAIDDVLAWKMPGAGGGGYLACVVKDTESFCKNHPEAIKLKIRRSGF